MAMDDLYSRIVSQRGSAEQSLIKHLPGFRGYMEMNARRQADRMVRDQVAEQLRQQLSRLSVIEITLLDSGGLKYMSKTRSAKTKFQTLIDRIATEAPGYSGFFDSIKIGANDLEVVYAFDLALMEYVDKFKTKLDTLQQAARDNNAETIDAAIADLDSLTIEANDAFSLRDNVLKGLDTQ
jgi:hypothetical protein